MTRVLSPRAWALTGVVAVMIVWGSTFVVTKAAVHEIPPFTLAALRFAIAALVLSPVAITRGGLAQLPRPVAFGRLALMALTGVVGFTVLFNYALLYGSASQGALIFAFAPAAIALGAVLVLAESPS
jgi:drug/metabolite transporter (DMT)-like permease